MLIELLSTNVQRAAWRVWRAITTLELRHSAAQVVPIRLLTSRIMRSAERGEASLGSMTTLGLVFMLVLVSLVARLLVSI